MHGFITDEDEVRPVDPATERICAACRLVTPLRMDACTVCDAYGAPRSRTRAPQRSGIWTDIEIHLGWVQPRRTALTG